MTIDASPSFPFRLDPWSDDLTDQDRCLDQTRQDMTWHDKTSPPFSLLTPLVLFRLDHDQYYSYDYNYDYDYNYFSFFPQMTPIPTTPPLLDNKVSWCSWLSHHLDVVRVPGSNPGGTIFTWLLNTTQQKTRQEKRREQKICDVMWCDELTTLDFSPIDWVRHDMT